MKFNTEDKHTVVLLSLVATIYFLLLILLNKYYALTFSHFVSLCKIAITSFLAYKTHLFGLVILTLILMGSTLLILRVLITYLKTRRRINTLLKLETDKQYDDLTRIVSTSHLKPSQVIVANTKRHLAFNFGLIKPKIAISTGLIQDLSSKELEAIILHESYHLKRSHVSLFLLTEISKALLFFIPVINTIVRKVRLEFEIEADEAAISFQGTNKHLRLALAKTLNPTPYLDLNPNFSTSLLEQRIGKLLSKDIQISFKKRETLISLSIISILVAMFVFPTTGHTHAEYGELNIQPSCENTQVNSSLLTINMTSAY